jgi:hypothetical protein
LYICAETVEDDPLPAPLFGSPRTPSPFDAYWGSDPFTFICFDPQDTDVVREEIVKWQMEGFKLWFDDGMPGGRTDKEEKAKAWDQCSLFVAFITPRLVASASLKKEIIHALDLEKSFLAIYLEDTELPQGLQLCMTGHQALFKYEMIEKRYYRKIQSVLETCASSPSV